MANSCVKYVFEVLCVYLYYAQQVYKIQDDIQDGSQNMKTHNFNQSLHLTRNASDYFLFYTRISKF